MAVPPWSLVILTGGQSRRMGRDKSRIRVAGHTMLDRLLTHIPDTIPVVVVGPEPEATGRPITVTREQPAGGGPAAGVVAGLEQVRSPIVVVAAVDLPFAGSALPGLAAMLQHQDQQVEAVMPIVDGHPQPLAAAYRAVALRQAAIGMGGAAGRSVRDLVAPLRVLEFAGGGEFVDVDTPADLAAALAAPAAADDDIMSPIEEAPMDKWVAAVAAELGVDYDVDVDLVLDVAKDAAHQVQRPAAPVTTYLLGAAVADGQDPQEAAAKVRALAARWPDQD